MVGVMVRVRVKLVGLKRAVGFVQTEVAYFDLALACNQNIVNFQITTDETGLVK